MRTAIGIGGAASGREDFVGVMGFAVEAEIVRDLTLASSGLLEPAIGGPSVFSSTSWPTTGSATSLQCVGGMISGLYDGTQTGVHSYKNTGFGVAFNVNDDLSVSYGQYDSRKAGYNDDSDVGGPEDRIIEVESWQAAYTMGGASFRIADVKVDNALFARASDLNATVVSLSLAF